MEKTETIEETLILIKALAKTLKETIKRIEVIEQTISPLQSELVIFSTLTPTGCSVYSRLRNQKGQILLDLTTPKKETEVEAIKITVFRLQDIVDLTYHPIKNIVLRTNLDFEKEYLSLIKWLHELFRDQGIVAIEKIKEVK